MKKIFFIVYILLFSFGIQAQEITKTLGDFLALKVYDRINATLIPSTENKVEIFGDKASEVKIVNNNGVLGLKMPFKNLLQGESIHVKIYFTNIESIEANEGAVVNCHTILETLFFDLLAKEGASIDVQLKNTRTNIKVHSGGNIQIKGTTENQDIVMTTGAIFEGEAFKSKQTTISLNAGGSATVFATDFVDAKVRAGGDIYIHGNPTQINQKTVLGGNIISVDR
jgi:hypothetical protein